MNLHNQRDSPRTRPPVPLFSQSTNNNKLMATASLANSEGSPPSDKEHPRYLKLTLNPLDMHIMNDFVFTDFTSAPDAQSSYLDDNLDFSHSASFDSVSEHPVSAQTTPQTISPKDVMLDNLSAPPSTTMTNLTTPGTSIYDSPWVANSTETSPLFGEDELEEGAKNWPSLFGPLDEHPEAPAMTHSMSNNSSSDPVSHFDRSPATNYVSPAPRMSRNNSSPGQAGSKSSHHSSFSGVNSRKRDKPLPAITIEDPSDTVAIKRARNTMAARKSRQKRMERTEQLESEVAALTEEKDYWKRAALASGYVE